MFHADAHKLIQEIRVMQMETSLLGAPFSNDALYAVLQRCTIQHPIYKETVTTVHQVSFDALAMALTTHQSSMENVPGQKVDPWQASARVAGSNEEQADDTESDMGSTRTTTRPKRICCWLPKSEETTCWILDSGVSYHMVNDHMKDRKHGLLEFRGNTWQQSTMTTSTPLFEGIDEEFELVNQRQKISTRQLWHEHLGHPGRDKSRVIIDKLKGEPVAALDPDTALTYSSHVTEYTCTLVLVDNYSNFIPRDTDRQEAESYPIRSRNQMESNEALEWLLEKGIEWQTTIGYNSRQNG
ncbi:hypothetical protein NDA11_004556 [Ustilago hordei]|nr:hypothetical protein NDA11_004556 [Ustilago hordei]KAJ1603099.1 hypothetical protein NDA14_003569 [Ustilago hordei]